MFLCSIETVKIKEFIFNTPKLKTIRGASFLLDYLNQEVVRCILSEERIEDKDILYIAAGNAKFYCDSKDKIKKIKERILSIYNALAPDAKIIISYKDVSGLKIWDAIDELAKETAHIKNRGFSRLNVDLPFIERCGICCDNPAEIDVTNFDDHLKEYIEKIEKFSDIGDKNDLKQIKNNLFKEFQGICPSCFAKYVASNLIKRNVGKVGFYSELNEKFKQKYKLVNSLEEYNLYKSYIGFIYSDGDSVGEFLKNIKDKFNSDNIDGEESYKRFLKEFSSKLDKNTKDSLLEVLVEMVENNKLDRYLGEFLIVGGDDVCAIFPANVALEISVKFQKRFEEKMKKYYENSGIGDFNGDNITASSGVVIAKVKTPLYYLFDQSLKLQKNAKRKRYNFYKNRVEIDLKSGFIDFQVIGGEGNSDIDKFRLEKDKVMKRPYICSTECIDGSIDSLVEKIRALKRCGFPKNKLRKYYELKIEAIENENVSLENLYKIISTFSNLNKEQLDLVIKWIDKDNLEVMNRDTLNNILENIFDVVEIYDFVEGD